jgi:sugar transferase (PEP-CTERM system associated)
LGLLSRRIVVVGSAQHAARITQAISGMRKGFFEVHGVVPISAVQEIQPQDLRAQHVWGVVVTADARASVPVACLLAVKSAGVRVFGDIDFREQQLRRMDLDQMAPDWLLYTDALACGPVERGLRRLAEIMISVGLLLLTLPVLAIAALAIRIDSPGPVLYRQSRVGLNGRIFTLIKLRSMRTDAEAKGPAWAAKGDPRVTRVGAFLRKTRIDELPQLINVLRGEMGFVGPRPERPHFVDQLAEIIPFYRDRNFVKPGVTGWAQVNYPYGASIEDARQKLSYDLYYVKHRSLMLDAFIVLATIRVILFQEGAR